MVDRLGDSSPNPEDDIVILGPAIEAEDLVVLLDPEPKEELVTLLGEDFEGELNGAFQRLQIGRAGLPARSGSGLVTARDVIQSYRDVVSAKSEISEEDALSQVLEMHGIPLGEAVKIGVLWGRAYPQPELSPVENFMAQPLDLRKREAPQVPDLNPRRRPGVIDRMRSSIRRIIPPSV